MRWPRPFAFEHSNLLPEGEDFQSRVASAAEEDADHSEDGEDEFCHEITLVTWRNGVPSSQPEESRKSLTAMHHELLSTDSGSSFEGRHRGHGQPRSALSARRKT